MNDTPLPVINLKLPTKEEDERAKAFAVHKNYVSAISSYIFNAWGTPPTHIEDLLKTQQALSGYSKMQAKTPPSPIDVHRCLTISWASELQLQLGAAVDPVTLRYSNVWAPVHAYYAIYMSLQAWFAMNGMLHLTDDHTSSLRTIANMVASRSLFPAPWNVTCTGCPQLGTVSFHNAPPDAECGGDIEVLSRPVASTFWPRYGKMLETTRRRRLERNFGEWKKSRGRKAMKQAEKLQVEKNLPPTTMFDFFWRLRVRANYRDVSSFLTWNVDDLEQQEFSEGLTNVVEATCALLQSLVVRAGARRLYQDSGAGFLSAHSGRVGTALQFLDRRIAALA